MILIFLNIIQENMKYNNSKHRLKKYISLIVMVAICAALLVGAVVTVYGALDLDLHVHTKYCNPTPVRAKDATCEEDGYPEHLECNGDWVVAKTVKPKIGSSYTSYEKTDPIVYPNKGGHKYQLIDNHDGTHSGKCTRSGCSSVQESQPHNLKYDVNSDGTHTATCADGCGFSETKPHSFGNWTTTKAETCGAKGTQKRTCVCGKTETKEIPATGNHTWASTPTDNGDGTHSTKCTVCGAVKPDSKTAHTRVWSVEEGNYEKYASYHVCKCKDCGVTLDTHYVTRESYANSISSITFNKVSVDVFREYEARAATCKLEEIKGHYFKCPHDECGLCFTAEDYSFAETGFHGAPRFKQVNESAMRGSTNDNNHANTAYKQASNPSEGHIKYCKDCSTDLTGVVAHTNWKKLDGADANGYVTITAVSCTQDGHYYRICDDCGYREDSYPKANGPHAYTYEDKGNGTHDYSCSKCKDSGNEAHTLELVPKEEPTCTEAGREAYYKCKCGATYKDIDGKEKVTDLSTLDIKATGHSFVWEVTDIIYHQGTCKCGAKTEKHVFNPTDYVYSDNGNDTHSFKCNQCDIVFNTNAHTWDDGKITTAAKCGVAGVKTFSCKYCTATKTEVISALSHDYKYENIGNGKHKITCKRDGCDYCVEEEHGAGNIEHIDLKEAKCDEPGNIECWHCKVCDTYFKDSNCTEEISKDSVITTKPHNYTKWVSIDDRSWLEQHSATSCHYRVCENCNAEEPGSRHIAAKDDYATITGKVFDSNWKQFIKHGECEATCVSDGVKADYYECPQCHLCFTYDKQNINFSEIIEKNYIIEKNPDNHSYKTIPDPTNPKNGHIQKCQREGCTNAINLNYGNEGLAQHEWESTENDGWVVDTQTTCMMNGLEKRVCKVCKNGNDAYYETRAIVANGSHTFDDWYDNKDGTHSRECKAQGCNEKETEPHGTLTHHTAKDSTCTEEGNKEYWYCEVCKAYFKDEEGKDPTTQEAVTIAKKPHEYTTWKTKKNEYMKIEYYTHVKACSCGEVEPGSEHFTTSSWGKADSIKDWLLEKFNIQNPRSYTTIGETDSTCVTQGTHACYQCPECEQYFSSNGITAEIKTADEVFKALDSSNHEDKSYYNYQKKENPADGHYRYCSKCNTTDSSAHNYGDWQETLTPTCSAKGEHKRTCQDCQYEDVQELEINPNKHNYDNWTFDETTGNHIGTCLDCHNAVTNEPHDLDHVDEKAPTCTEAGNEEYWQCKDCHAYFSDAEGTNNISQADTVIKPTGHNLVWTVKVQTSSDPYGLSCHIKKCNNPGCTYEDEATMHYAVKAEVKNAENTLNSLLTQVGLGGVNNDVVAFTKHPQKEPNCTETGAKATYYECTTDGLCFVEREHSTALTWDSLTSGKVFSDIWNDIKNIQEPYFSKVNKDDYFLDKDPDNHDFTKYIPVEANKDAGHIRICSRCSEEDTTFSQAVHTWDTSLVGADAGGWIIDDQSTCTQEGTKHRVCSACEYEQSGTVEKDTHHYVWKYDESAGKYVESCTGDCNGTHAKVNFNKQAHASVTVSYASNGTGSVLTIVPEPGYYVKAITKSENDGEASSIPENSESVTTGIAYNSGTATYKFTAAETDVFNFNITVEEELPLTGNFKVPLWEDHADIKANLSEYEALVFSKIVNTETAPLKVTDVSIKYWYGLDTLLLSRLSNLTTKEELAALDFDDVSSFNINELSWSDIENLNRHKFGQKLTKVGTNLVGIDYTEHLNISYTSKGEGDKFTTYSIRGAALKNNYKDSNIFSVTLTDTCKVSIKGGDSVGCKSYGFDESHKDYIYVDKKDGGTEVSFTAEPEEGYIITVQKSGLLTSQTVEKGQDGKYHVTVTDDATYELKFVPANMQEDESNNGKGNLVVSIIRALGDGVETAVEASPVANYYVNKVTIIDKTTEKPVELDGSYQDGNYIANFINKLSDQYDIIIDYDPVLPQKEAKAVSINNKNPTGTAFAKYLFDSLVDEGSMPDIFGEDDNTPNFEDVIKVEYFAGPAALLKYAEDPTLQKIMTGLNKLGINLSGWKVVASDESKASAKSGNNAKAQALDATVEALLKEAEQGLTEAVKDALDKNDLYHDFGSRESETLRVTYTAPDGENKYPSAELITEVEIKDLRADTEVALDSDTCSLVWKSESHYDAILKHAGVNQTGGEGKKGVSVDASELSIIVKDSKGKTYETKEEIDKLDAGEYTATVAYEGTERLKSAKSTEMKLIVEKATVAKFEVEDNVYDYTGEEYAAKVTSLNSNGDTIPYITVTAGVDASLKGEAFLYVHPQTNVEILGVTIGQIYEIIKLIAKENTTLTLKDLISNLTTVSEKLDELIKTTQDVTGNAVWEKVEDLLETNVGTDATEKLTTISGYLKETIEYLKKTADAIGEDASITLDHHPKNAGVYGVYGMALDKNYNYDYDFGYVTIRPVDKYTISWKKNLDGTSFLTSDKVTDIDFGAELYEGDTLVTEGRPQITYVVYGINNKLEIELKRTTNSADLNAIFATPGTYREAVIILGNEATGTSRNITITKPYAEWSVVKIFTQIKEKAFTFINNLGKGIGNEALATKLINMISKINSSLALFLKE